MCWTWMTQFVMCVGGLSVATPQLLSNPWDVITGLSMMRLGSSSSLERRREVQTDWQVSSRYGQRDWTHRWRRSLSLSVGQWFTSVQATVCVSVSVCWWRCTSLLSYSSQLHQSRLLTSRRPQTLQPLALISQTVWGRWKSMLYYEALSFCKYYGRSFICKQTFLNQ